MSGLPTGFYSLDPTGGAGDADSLNALTNSNGDRRVLLGAGTFGLTNSWQLLRNSIGVNGIARGATRIRHDVAGDTDGILIKNVNGCDVRDLTITSTSARTAGAGLKVVGGNPTDYLDTYPLTDSGIHIDHVDMDNQFNGLVFENDTVNDYRTWRATVYGGRIKNISAGGTGCWINTAPSGGNGKFGGSQKIQGLDIEPSSAAALANYRITGTGGCHILGGYEVYGALVSGTQYAMLIDPPTGGFVTSVNIEGGFLDRSQLACLRIAPHASVYRFGAIQFTGVWFAGCTAGDVLQIVGTAAKFISFVNCTFMSAEASGKWLGVIDGASYVDFIGCRFGGGNAGGLKFTNSASNFRVVNCSFHPNLVNTGYDGLPIAVQIDDSCDNYKIIGNTWSDAAITSKLQNQAGSAITPTATKIIANNA